MFNWLKNKLNNLVPSDANKGFLTSNFTTIKVGDKVTIPENLVCLVCYRDKTYTELKSGTFSLDESLLKDLYNKQKKKRKKIKKLDLDLFFVNLNSQILNVSYIDKIPVKRKTTKLNFEIEATLNVCDAKVFNKFICAELYQPLAITTNNLVKDIIEELVKKYFLKICLEDHYVSQNIIDNLIETLKKSLTKIGLNLKQLKLSTFNKKESKTNQSTTINHPPINNENLGNSNEKSSNPVDQTKNINYNSSEPTQQHNTTCTSCGAKIIKGSIFCHRCGNVLR